MIINVAFSGLANFFRAGATAGRMLGGVPFSGGGFSELKNVFNLLLKHGQLLTLFKGAAAALTAFTVAAITASRRIAAQGMAGFSMGGTAAQGLQLRGFAGAAGISMDQMGALGEQVGGFNRAGRLLQEIQTIRSLARWEDVLLYTRGRGLESLQAVWFLTREQTQALNREAQARKGLYDLQATARAVQFNYELKRLQNNFDDFIAGIGGVFIPVLSDALQWVNQFLGKTISGGNEQQRHTEAIRQHTAALNGSARTMGGGARAQAALPPALKGEAFNDAARRRALSFGALIP